MDNKKQSKKQEVIKNLIVKTTKEIIAEEGLDKVSVRKITNRMGYSPGSIYHYFSDKDEIINYVFNIGYQEIIMVVANELNKEGSPEEILDKAISAYIAVVMKNSLEYKEIISSNNPLIKEKTSLLYQGAAKNNRFIQMIAKNLEEGISKGVYRDMEVEVTAQIIWTTAFGLAFKMTREDISENYRKKLIKALKDSIFSILEVK